MYISSHHTHTQNKSSSEIAFVVLRLHCQLKVVPEGTFLILSKSGIEHAEETFRRARVGGVCQQRSQHKRKVRKRSRVAPPPLRHGKPLACHEAPPCSDAQVSASGHFHCTDTPDGGPTDQLCLRPVSAQGSCASCPGHRPFCARTLTWVPGAVGSHAKESAAMHRLPYRGVSALTPYGGHPSAHDSRGPGRRTLPRAAHLFLPRALEALG